MDINRHTHTDRHTQSLESTNKHTHTHTYIQTYIHTYTHTPRLLHGKVPGAGGCTFAKGTLVVDDARKKGVEDLWVCGCVYMCVSGVEEEGVGGEKREMCVGGVSLCIYDGTRKKMLPGSSLSVCTNLHHTHTYTHTHTHTLTHRFMRHTLRPIRLTNHVKGALFPNLCQQIDHHINTKLVRGLVTERGAFALRALEADFACVMFVCVCVCEWVRESG
jgi:hypothetical protein